jgi:hypothetical protein
MAEIWFKKRHGNVCGWHPVKWQGWAITFGYLGVVGLSIAVRHLWLSETFYAAFLTPLTGFLGLAVLIWIIYRRGER